MRYHQDCLVVNRKRNKVEAIRGCGLKVQGLLAHGQRVQGLGEVLQCREKGVVLTVTAQRRLRA